MDERTVAGAGYILSFFNDIEQLTTYFANYINVFVELKAKYKGVGDNELSDRLVEEDRDELVSLVQGMRTWIVRTYVKAKALSSHIASFNVETLEAKYKEVTQKFILNPDDIESYVIEINKAFTEGVLKDLLVQAHDIYARLTE